MKIHTAQVGMVGTNCYLVETEEKNCAVVDPGGEGPRLVEWIKALGLTPKMVLLTHGHFDHIGGLDAIVEAFPDIKIYIGAGELPIVEWSKSSLSNPKIVGIIVNNGVLLKDGEQVTVDEVTFKVVHTPGHTQGGVVYLAAGNMFSGDTLFRREIGRCDFFTGDYQVMLQSLKKLADLEGDFDVYPGHEGATTLEEERKLNHYMRQVL